MRRGRRGEGSVYYSRSDKRWVARYPLGVIGGKRASKRVKCSSERVARGELERLRRAYAAGGSLTNETLDRYLRRWLDGHRDVRASTHRSYADHIRNHISPLVGGIPVSALRAADIDRLIGDRLAAGLSPSTVRRIVTTLHIALNAGVRRGELSVNVAGQVKLPRVDAKPVAAMSLIEAERIIEAVHGHWLEPIVRLLIGSGLRLGEAVGLNQSDVAGAVGYVRLRTSKTRLRAVTVSDDAMAALQLALAIAPRRGSDEPLFFGPRTGHRLTVGAVSHAFPRLLAAHGLPRVTPHGLRHGAATIMAAHGVPMRDIAEQLGHRNPGFTARVYAHVVPESLRAAVDKLPKGRATG